MPPGLQQRDAAVAMEDKGKCREGRRESEVASKQLEKSYQVVSSSVALLSVFQ